MNKLKKDYLKQLFHYNRMSYILSFKFLITFFISSRRKKAIYLFILKSKHIMDDGWPCSKIMKNRSQRY